MDELEKQLKRREQNISLIKFAIGTVILGAVGLYINWYYQKESLELEITKQESESFNAFMENFIPMKDNDMKIHYIEMMRVISQSEKIQERYDSLKIYVMGQIDSTNVLKEDEKAKYSQVDEGTIERIDKLELMVKTGFNPETNEQLTEAELIMSEDSLDKLLEDDKVKDFITASHKLEEYEAEIIPIEIPEKVNLESEDNVILYRKDWWLKEDYFHEHDGLILAVMSIDKDDEIAEMQLRTSKVRNKGIIKELKMSKGETAYIDYKGKHIEIAINRFGRAGKNPLNTAVYYSIKVTKT